LKSDLFYFIFIYIIRGEIIGTRLKLESFKRQTDVSKMTTLHTWFRRTRTI